MVLEGGANLGGCLLWAAAALQAVGGFVVSVALEPMYEAWRLFELSVLEGGLAQQIHVERKALTAPNVESSILRYIPGRHGQASLDAHSHSGCETGQGQEYCVDEVVEATTVDLAWARRFGPDFQMDVLKLNVNGEELNTLRGSRALLSKRKICTVMMHIFKMQYAIRWERELLSREAPAEARNAAAGKVRAFSNEVDILHTEAGMELLLYIDPPIKEFEADEAVSIPILSRDALHSVLEVHVEELTTVANELLGRNRQRLHESGQQHLPDYDNDFPKVLPFPIEGFHQSFILARTRRDVEGCRPSSYDFFPIR